MLRTSVFNLRTTCHLVIYFDQFELLGSRYRRMLPRRLNSHFGTQLTASTDIKWRRHVINITNMCCIYHIGNSSIRAQYLSMSSNTNYASNQTMMTTCHLSSCNSYNYHSLIASRINSSRRHFATSNDDDRPPPSPKRYPDNKHRDFYRSSRLRLRKTHKAILETRERVKETVEKMIMRENILTIPNVLCVTRIILSPVIAYLVTESNFEWALGLFIFAGITDLLDGYIARNFENQQTMFGSFLDPFADKLLVFCLMLTLTYRDMIPVPLTALVFLRDALLVIAALYIRYVSLPHPKTFSRYFDVTMVTARLKPTTLSKLNTAIQLTLVGITLTSPLLTYDPSTYLPFMWYFTTMTTILSACSYAMSKDTYQLFREIKEK